MKVLDSRLRDAERKKEQQEQALALQSIPNSELTHSKCICGSVTWQPTMILFTIPALHPKNKTGRHINRAENVLVCTECKKAHPDQLDPQDGAYIENLPKELKPKERTKYPILEKGQLMRSLWGDVNSYGKTIVKVIDNRTETDECFDGEIVERGNCKEEVGTIQGFTKHGWGTVTK